MPNATDAGNYFMAASDSAGIWVTSRVATLQVDTTFTRVITGPVVEDTGDFWIPAWGDFDNDGQVDLLVCNGAFVGNSFNLLYGNVGNGVFDRVTTGPITEDGGSFMSGIWGDFDKDGHLDLFIANRQTSGANLLYRNLGGTCPICGAKRQAFTRVD